MSQFQTPTRRNPNNTSQESLHTPVSSPFAEYFGVNWLSPSSLQYFPPSPATMPGPPPQQGGTMDISTAKDLTKCFQNASSSSSSSFSDVDDIPDDLEVIKAEASKMLHSGYFDQAIIVAERGLCLLRSAGGGGSPGTSNPVVDAVYLSLLMSEANTHLSNWSIAEETLVWVSKVLEQNIEETEEDSRYDQTPTTATSSTQSYDNATLKLLAVNCYNDMAYLHRLRGNLDTAFDLYQKALNMQEALHGPVSVAVASCYNNLGLVLTTQGRYQEALESFFHSNAIRWQVLSSKTDSDGGDVLSSNIEGEEDGNTSKATPKVVMQLVTKIEGNSGHNTTTTTTIPVDMDTATVLNNIANIYMHLGEYRVAIEYYTQALTILEAAGYTYHPDTATSYSNIGTACKELAQYPKAVDMYYKALELRKHILGEHHTSTTACRIMIANVEVKMGMLDSARHNYQQALSIRESTSGENSVEAAACYTGLGHVAFAKSELSDSLEWYQKAYHTCVQELGTHHSDTRLCLGNVAAIQMVSGNATTALQIFTALKDYCTQAFGVNHVETAIQLNNIGNVHRVQGRKEDALEHYNDALATLEQSLGSPSLCAATVYSNLSALQFNCGKFKKAQKLLYTTKAMREQLLGDKHIESASTYYSLAVVQAAQQQWGPALESAKRCQNIVNYIYATSQNGSGSGSGGGSGKWGQSGLVQGTPHMLETSKLIAVIQRRSAHFKAITHYAPTTWDRIVMVTDDNQQGSWGHSCHSHGRHRHHKGGKIAQQHTKVKVLKEKKASNPNAAPQPSS
eukprot:TRINITY_DN66791_c7_g10_i1.p1 TRINITY_DN66791_c7_g10~~TRINITY_DN66791_c7_g10_i1.p1  ORF type:complete len:794 (-),score=86.78 TRINITY_DN66791_c7_g10_i1:604-2985(-)